MSSTTSNSDVDTAAVLVPAAEAARSTAMTVIKSTAALHLVTTVQAAMRNQQQNCQ